MYRLLLKHKLISTVIITAVLCAAISPFLWKIRSDAWIYAIFYLFFAVLSFGFVESSSDRLMRTASKALSEGCDPTPLLRETKEQLKYVKHGVANQLVLLNYTVALGYMGEYSGVIETLETFDTDKYKFLSPYRGFINMIYYNNMSDAYDELGDFENASLWHKKTMISAKKLGMSNSKEIILAKALENLRKKEFKAALETLESFKGKTLLDSVCASMVYAKVYIGLGEKEKAKEKLDFIVENGNKLYMVEQAKKMLENI